jgi:hypothetical protein
VPRHETAHAALVADILDVLHGSYLDSQGRDLITPAEQLSPTEPKRARPSTPCPAWTSS